MRRWGLDGTSSRVVEQEGSTTVEFWEVCLQEGTIPSVTTAEPPELMRSLSKLELGREPAWEAQTVGRHTLTDGPTGGWKASCFHASGSGTGDTYSGRFTFTRVAKRSRWGKFKTLHVPFNTFGRIDHSLGRTWPGQLGWSARMFFLPRSYLADNWTKFHSIHLVIPEAMRHSVWDTVLPWCQR